MTSQTLMPSIEQGALQDFQSNFFQLAEQKQSKLASSPAVVYLPSGGKTQNLARMGSTELVEVNERNPDKQISDYSIDNRQLSKRRFTRTILIDAKHDINELIADPTGSLVTKLDTASKRVMDRVIAAAAVGPVLVGKPNEAPTSYTAAADGVITVDASAGLTYEKILEVTENFVNNDLEESDIKGSIICVTGAEQTDLMSEIEFVSQDYISGRPVEESMMDEAGTYMLEKFAGSVTGGITKPNPILPEGATLRKCMALAPESISVSMELALMEVVKSATKVNSYEVTVDLWINAMRNEGVRVQQINTTI